MISTYLSQRVQVLLLVRRIIPFFLTNKYTVDEIKQLKKQTKLMRKKRYYKSKLEPKRAKLLLMHSKGASIAEIQRWLLSERIKVNYSTVYRFIKG